MADATAEEHAALGLAEARVLEAKAQAREKEGEAAAKSIEYQNEAEAKGIELKGEAQAEADRKKGEVEAKIAIDKGLAEAQVLEAKATATEKMGSSEATVIEMKGIADAKGVAAKAEAMQKLDGVGREHEEFKLRLNKEKEIELAQIGIQKDIAASQASVLAEALKAANIDIVGGEQEFFDRISKAVLNGKYVDRFVNNSDHLQDLKHALIGNGGGDLSSKLRDLMSQFSLGSEDIKNLTISALIVKMLNQTQDEGQQGVLRSLLGMAQSMGLADQKASVLGLSV